MKGLIAVNYIYVYIYNYFYVIYLELLPSKNTVRNTINTIQPKYVLISTNEPFITIAFMYPH